LARLRRLPDRFGARPYGQNRKKGQEKPSRPLGVDAHSDPRERLLSVFEAQATMIAEPEYNGCAFSSATSESHSASVDEATTAYRQWFRNLFKDLAAAAGAKDAPELARQLQLLYDGASQSARMDGDPGAAGSARAAAEQLLAAATTRRR
jgi:hypothetical protein